ncbi:MAG: MFS transporter [Paenirhodobacter sp.]|uniref:MFS transporter n=1 Tax=Paenirhodobacter sp. TaxID=1965326 RepID=UPI003D096D8F
MRQVFTVSRATGISLAVLGMFWGAFAAYLPVYKARAGVADGLFGTLLLGSALGGMVAMALAPRIGRALGPRVLPVCAGALAIAALAPLAIGSAVTLALALFVMGAAMSSLDIAANVRISELEQETGLHLMNGNHALFSLALGAAAFLAGLARQAGAAPEIAVPVLALLLALVALTLRDRHAAHGQVEAAAPAGVPSWAVVLPAAAILFAAFVTESATETWSALHIERDLGGRAGEGAFGPAMFGIVMGVFRLAGQGIATRLGEARLVALSALLGVIGGFVTAVAGSQVLAVLGIGLIGAGVAVVVPSANSLLGRRVGPTERATAISRAWMIGFTGFFIGPVVMGLIAERAGLAAIFLAVALVMAAILPGLARLMRAGARHA